MAVTNSDGSIILKTNVDTSGMQKGTKSLRSEAMKLAAEYRKAGMSQSEAQKRAYKELGITTKETEKAKKATKEYGEEAEKTGSKASRSFSYLSNGLKSIGKASLAIGAVAGASIVALTKQAISAYADYEQLVGGVETLFGENAEKVKAFAEDAFATAGMSANEYMQTVTSFSASLISSLGGDTDKAADVANMALIDMADNANKMGTAMESIQYAYQGFAKQNYTMLDNLKLGKIHHCRV